MKGKNPIRPPVQDDGRKLAVKAIFATLQGEGIYSGWSAVFVRLGGCNLACGFCDTDFENFADMVMGDIAGQVMSLMKGAEKLVVITGGEPLRQNIAPLCEALIQEGCKIQVETNGTLYRPLPDGVDIICSPKNTGTGYQKIRGDLLPKISAFKFIISADIADYQNIGDVGQGLYHTPVYVQPMDEGDATKNANNMKRATELAMQHGYRLSIQMHKLVGIP